VAGAASSQPLGQAVTRAGAWQTPPENARTQPAGVLGQGGSKAHTTPAPDVAGSIMRQGPVGHCSTLKGASQVLPIESSARHSGGHEPTVKPLPLTVGLGVGRLEGEGVGAGVGRVERGARVRRTDGEAVVALTTGLTGWAVGLWLRSARQAHVTPRVEVLGRVRTMVAGHDGLPRMGPRHWPLGSDE